MVNLVESNLFVQQVFPVLSVNPKDFLWTTLQLVTC